MTKRKVRPVAETPLARTQAKETIKAPQVKKVTAKAPAANLPAIFQAACAQPNAQQAADVLGQFPPGQHTGAILSNLAGGVPDIRSLLHYLAATYRPAVYLEVGVRLGYSLAMVAAASPDTAIIGVDMWQPNFGGEPNGSPEQVAGQLKAMGYNPRMELVSGDSQVVLPKLRAKFDLILLDVGGSTEAALADLRAALGQLTPGGFLVFDDLNNSALASAWETIQAEEPGLVYHAEGIVGLAYRS